MTTAEIGVPEGFQLAISEGVWRLSLRARGHWVCIAGGTCGLALTGGLLAIFALTSQQGLATLLFALGAILSAYVLLVGLVNRTVVSVDQGLLKAGHGPIPCLLPPVFHLRSRAQIAVEDIRGLYVSEEQQRDSQGRIYCTYAIHVVTPSRGREELLTRLQMDEAHYVQEELKAFLGLEL